MSNLFHSTNWHTITKNATKAKYISLRYTDGKSQLAERNDEEGWENSFQIFKEKIAF